jgi:small subunit ribosomal protein S5
MSTDTPSDSPVPSAPAAVADAPAHTPAPAPSPTPSSGGPGGGGPGGNRGPGGPGGNRGPGGGNRFGGRGSGRPAPRRDNRDQKPQDGDGPALVEKVVFVNRCAKVVKGGRRFSFAALVVVGDQKGNVGIGYGKANEVPDAIKKGTESAKKKFVHVKLKGDSIPHDVFGQFDGGKVLLKPASPGTGLIAGGGVRAVLEAAGIKNILTKSMGSNNHIAVVNATMDALLQLRLSEDILKIRQS